jgi:ketosteroid isomerase-like protein
MSRENVEVVRRAFAALARRDVDVWVTEWHPECEFIPIFARVEGRAYHGHDGLRRFDEEIDADWSLFEVRPEEFRDFGDRVLVLGTWLARGRASGVELDSAPAAWVLELRDGKIVRSETFTDRAAALEAVGLRE